MTDFDGLGGSRVRPSLPGQGFLIHRMVRKCLDRLLHHAKHRLLLAKVHVLATDEFVDVQPSDDS